MKKLMGQNELYEKNLEIEKWENDSYIHKKAKEKEYLIEIEIIK